MNFKIQEVSCFHNRGNEIIQELDKTTLDDSVHIATSIGIVLRRNDCGSDAVASYDDTFMIIVFGDVEESN